MTADPALNAEGLPVGYPFDPAWEVTPRDARRLSGGEAGAVLLDVRTPMELATAAVAGAVAVPMAVVPAKLDELRAYDGRKVIVFCHHGGRSMKVARYLREQGLRDVYSMAGGIEVWSRDIDPAVPRY